MLVNLCWGSLWAEGDAHPAFTFCWGEVGSQLWKHWVKCFGMKVITVWKYWIKQIIPSLPCSPGVFSLLSGNFLSQRFYASLCIQPWIDKCVQLFEGIDSLLIGKTCSGNNYCSTAELCCSVPLFYPCCLIVPLDTLVSWWTPSSVSIFSLFVIDLSKVHLFSSQFCFLFFPFRSRYLGRVWLSPQ